ncbi:MAG TPA: hypothetical protein DEF45_20465 [Rhodopirellula sp.]|nr:hypothetical protein [Rhodopirellula sp.]
MTCSPKNPALEQRKEDTKPISFHLLILGRPAEISQLKSLDRIKMLISVLISAINRCDANCVRKSADSTQLQAGTFAFGGSN